MTNHSRRRNDDPSSKQRTSPVLWIILAIAGAGLALACVVGIVIAIAVASHTASRSTAPGTRSRFSGMPELVAHWSFNEQNGDIIPDLSGRGHDAVLHGARLGEGVRGRGLHLDGRPDRYCELPATPDLDFPAGGAFTIAGWFRTDEPAATLLSLRHRDRNSQIDLLVRDGKFLAVVGDDTDPGTQNAFVFARQPNDGQWHHVAFTRNGASIELFIDGESQGTATAACVAGPITTNLRALGAERRWALDNDVRWGNPWCRGGIDEVCVFNRALSAAEIPRLMDR